jgi:hypothetical protein
MRAWMSKQSSWAEAMPELGVSWLDSFGSAEARSGVGRSFQGERGYMCRTSNKVLSPRSHDRQSSITASTISYNDEIESRPDW